MREHRSAGTVMCHVASVVKTVAKRHDVTTTFRWDDSFVDGGLTSAGMVELMLAIEEAFNVAVPDSELNAANFSSIATLSTLVFRLIAGRPHAVSAPTGVDKPQQFQGYASDR